MCRKPCPSSESTLPKSTLPDLESNTLTTQPHTPLLNFLTAQKAVFLIVLFSKCNPFPQSISAILGARPRSWFHNSEMK